MTQIEKMSPNVSPLAPLRMVPGPPLHWLLHPPSLVIDNVMESITIELCINKKMNVIVSCVYRTPGSNVDIYIQ